MCFAALLVVGSWDVLAHQHKSAQQNQAQYLGNEAVLITSGDTKLLFDPFFHSDFGIYQLVPESIRQNILQGNAPFDDVDVVFVSHAHADHFAAEEMLAYLLQHQEIKLIAPQQAISKLLVLPDAEKIKARLTTVSLEFGDPLWSQSLGQLKIEAVRIPHAGWPGRAEVENIVFRVVLGDTKSVMHMGDADARVEHYLPYREHWKTESTELAFPPYWFFDSLQGRDIVDEYLNIDHAVGVHVPKRVPKQTEEGNRDYFSKPGETRQF